MEFLVTLIGLSILVWLSILAFSPRSSGTVDQNQDSLIDEEAVAVEEKKYQGQLKKVELHRQRLTAELKPRIESLQGSIDADPLNLPLRFELGNMSLSVDELSDAKEQYEFILTQDFRDQRSLSFVRILYAHCLDSLMHPSRDLPERWPADFLTSSKEKLARGAELDSDILRPFMSGFMPGYVVRSRRRRRAYSSYGLDDEHQRYEATIDFQVKEALKAFESVIKTNPRDIEILRTLRNIYEWLGNPDNQVGQLENLIMKAESNARRARVIEKPVLASTAKKGLDFEHRCLRLLLAMGYSVDHSGKSGDGGIDIYAEDPTPISGGKLIVQCKDWRNPVGEPIIRDLYAQVMKERVNKGIVITTSTFTSSAQKYAVGNQIELIDGKMFSDLEQKYTIDS